MTDLEIIPSTIVLVTTFLASRTTPGTTAFVMPAGITKVSAKIFGAGGGGGGGGDGSPGTAGALGGGGGFIHVRDIGVIPGDTYNLTVGAGGNGGLDRNDAADGGSGGGQTFFEHSSGGTFAEAGAAGGGGGGDNSVGIPGIGGGGGGQVGGAGGIGGINTEGGGGGTQTAGGLGGAGEPGGDGANGDLELGGGGGDGDAAGSGSGVAGGLNFGGPAGLADGFVAGGGGGGCGRWGGGGGGSGTIASPGEGGGGGGGGSNFHDTLATLILSIRGSGGVGAGTTDVDYPGGVGGGGAGGVFVGPGFQSSFDGQGGAIVLLLEIPTISTNDLVFSNDAPQTVSGDDQVAQHVRMALLTCQAEWFLDESYGVPWFTRVIGQRFNPGQINITVRDTILAVDGVASIVDIVTARGAVARTANVTVTVLTTTGAEVITSAEVL